jgi:hypothetical protein
VRRDGEGVDEARQLGSGRARLSDKNNVNLLYSLPQEQCRSVVPIAFANQSQGSPGDYIDILSLSSGAFVFVALNQQQWRWQQGDAKDGGNGNGDGNGGGIVVKEGGGWMCYCPQWQLVGGGVGPWPCPPTCVSIP